MKFDIQRLRSLTTGKLYIGIPIEDFFHLISENALFNVLGNIDELIGDSVDDHNSVWGGTGPDCITERREAARL